MIKPLMKVIRGKHNTGCYKLALDFHDNQNRHGCVAVHEDSLYRPPTTNLAFRMGTTYNRLAQPGEHGQMGRNHVANARV
jgi:hypothetical protein